MEKIWAIVELMGHVRIAGMISEEEHFGIKIGRIDIPNPTGDGFVTQFFGGSSVYRITAVSEEAARIVAKKSSPHPVQPWEIPKSLLRVAETDSFSLRDDDAD